MLIYDNGILYKDFAIDSLKASHEKKHFLLTHAHSDHLKQWKNCNSRLIHCSPETKALALAENGFDEKSFQALKGGHEFLKENAISMYDSGHILGSKQYFFEEDSVLITGDLCYEDSLILKKAEALHAKTLIIETTFGMPEYVFPPREQLYEEIKEFVQQNIAEKKLIVFGGYSLGKNQELIALMNSIGINPAINEKTFIYSKIYNDFGKNLKFHLAKDLKDEDVFIMPSYLLSEHFCHALRATINRKIIPVLPTGWSMNKAFTSRLPSFKFFPLSNHCGYDKLFEFVEEVKPKSVFTYHGFDEEFASALRKKLGLNSHILKRKRQQLYLTEYF